MKKAISVILAILFVFSVSGCGDTRPDVPSETEHSHDVETVETTSETEHVHDFQIAETKEATCISPEKELYRCAECGEEKTETVGKPLGHLFASKEPANFGDYVVCEREDCDHIEIKWNPQYSDQLVYVSCEQDEEDMRELYAELHEILQSIGDYGSENTVDAGEEYAVFAEKYQRFNSLFDAINNMAYKAYLISRISFNGENVENYVEGMTAYIKAQELQAKMTLAIYNSAFRDIVYKDHSREELDLMIKKAGVTGNEELTALKIKNEEILASRYEINNYDERLALYGDFVENNKKIAALFGYENYWECANREIRFRDCSAEDVDLMFAYTKQYLIPLWKNRNIDIPAYGEKDASLIRALTKKPFYQDELAFNTMKDFFGKVNITYNNEKISALSLFEDVLKNGNCFITDGHTELTYSDEWSIPVLLYADNLVLANGTTYSVVHEFGHYINFISIPSMGCLIFAKRNR